MNSLVSTNGLLAFRTAWKKAYAHNVLPTLDDLDSLGAPLDHPGFGVMARTEETVRGKKRPIFSVLKAGSELERQIGRSLVGHRLDELVHPAHITQLTQLYESIFSDRKLHQWRCMNMVRNAPAKSYTRVIAPIRDDVGDGRCLAGIWIWHADTVEAQLSSAA